jgi:hypothetical protein
MGYVKVSTSQHPRVWSKLVHNVKAAVVETLCSKAKKWGWRRPWRVKKGAGSRQTALHFRRKRAHPPNKTAKQA